MKTHSLSDQKHARREIAAMFLKTTDRIAELEVREDRCFRRVNEWLNLGRLTLRPGGADHPSEPMLDVFGRAVGVGSYEWKLPQRDQLDNDLIKLCTFDDGTAVSEGQREKLTKALDGLVHALQRVGLMHPVFDASAVSVMPFSKPVTVVADTNSVLQGALDFVHRHLAPAARIRIPAIVQMEILVWVDNYFRLRYGAEKRLQKAVGAAFRDHLRGQGAQRALLRLELLSEAEIERSRTGADPLRGIVQLDPDQEHVNLGLQVIQRSFADRLILETAIQQQQHVTFGHQVFLLTSDQGVARMALAEGLQVLFYQAADIESITNLLIPGTLFNPFDGSLYSVPLTELLWELSVTFGSSRLRFLETNDCFEVQALGDKLGWNPYHSKEDLLWLLSTSGSTFTQGDNPPNGIESQPQAEETPEADSISQNLGAPVATPAEVPRTLLPSYKFSTRTMLRLIQLLVSGKEFGNEELMRHLGFTHERKLAEYRGFLVSGGFITYSRPILSKTEKLDQLWTALRVRNHSQLSDLLLKIDSVREFYETVRAHNPLRPNSDVLIKVDAIPNYRCLLELSGLVLQIPKEGIYPTPTRPTASEFALIAYSVYIDIARKEDQYIATGNWLETLAKHHQIHPIEARQRLDEARSAGLIERYVEGSTPDTRFAGRTFCMLDIANNELAVREVALYEGNFLIPGKGSASLRLKKVNL